MSLEDVVAKTEAAKKYLQETGILDHVIDGLSRLGLCRDPNPHQWLADYILSRAPGKPVDDVKETKGAPVAAASAAAPAAPAAGKTPLRIVLAGPPASGKGTQCEFVRDHYGIVHISTGDRLREAVASGTPLGQEAKKYMDEGKLVPDDLIISLVKELLSKEDVKAKGWLLDGFPRTVEQARALADAGIEPDIVLVLQVPPEKLVDRVTGRRLDPVTNKIYHLVTNPPENDEIASRLTQRADDTKEKIVTRIEAFQTNMTDIENHYKDKMISVDGDRDKNQVFAAVKGHVDQVVQIKEQ